MSKILINDLLNIPQSEWDNVRLKLNIPTNNSNPLELYKKNPDIVNTDWFLAHDGTRRYFYKGQTAICLLRLKEDTWLLTTIKKIDEVIEPNGGPGYVAHELSNEYGKFFGRVVIKYHNKIMGMGRKYAGIKDELEVVEILNEQYTGDDFPGYENVCLSYEQLSNIIKRPLLSWIGALENQKAVYLITDKSTGKLYVGSATAQGDMLLDRWRTYVSNGHGGNVELKELIKKEGFDYIKKNFQYSILENFNARMSDEYILGRESWWKNTLCSRIFGYNKN